MWGIDKKLTRFYNSSRKGNQFIIFDVPFDYATSYLSDITNLVDNLVLVIDSSIWGEGKALIKMCNLDDSGMMELMFNKAQIVFNRDIGMHRFMDKTVKNGYDILRAMDDQVFELQGEEYGIKFENMLISGIIPYDNDIIQSWYNTTAYSDTAKGSKIFLQLVENIILRK